MMIGGQQIGGSVGNLSVPVSFANPPSQMDQGDVTGIQPPKYIPGTQKVNPYKTWSGAQDIGGFLNDNGGTIITLTLLAILANMMLINLKLLKGVI